MSSFDIKKMLPHRFPFLMIDEIEEIDPGKSAVCIKKVSLDEPHFKGHFPGNPIMPGVLLIEAMAQAAGIAIGGISNNNKVGLLAQVSNAKFKDMVKPGDTIKINAKITGMKLNLVKAKCSVILNGKTAAFSELKMMLVDK